MRLTQIIVKRPVAAIMIIAAIVIFGAMALVGMPQELTPEMEMPMLIVSTVYPGAGPEDVEKLVTREVESAIGSLSGIKTISSYSMENSSMVLLQYEYGTNMDIAYTDVKAKLDGIVNSLPDDSRTPRVIELDVNAMASIYLSVTSDGQDSLLYYVEDTIVPELEKLSAVSDVSVSGGLEEYIRVEVMEEMLQQYGIPLSTVITSVGNVDYSSPLGSADHGDQDLAVRTEVKYDSIEAMRNIPIALDGGGTIRLSDVANIYAATKDASSISRYNGLENIGLSISKRQSTSAALLSRQVTSVIDELLEADPNLHIAVIQDASEFISSSINSIAQTMLLAIVLSMLVLFVFLGDFKASLIVGSSMPVSLLVTFILMNFMGYSLNIVSMSGLVLGVGMMVDNAIVVLDSCFKNSSKERDFAEAAVEGTQFVMLSIIASTITTVVVFLPLAMIEGMSGQLFGPLGFSIVFSLIASLFSAITLVPLFFVQFKPKERKNAPAALLLKRVERGYSRLLRKIIRKKLIVVIVTVVFLVSSIFLATKIPMELMPSTDEGIISIDVETKPGLKLERVDEIMSSLEAMVAAHEDVEHYTVSAGSGGLSALMGSGSSVTAYLIDDREMDTADVIEQWRLETQYLVDCDIDISSSSSTMSMSSGDSAQIKLLGNDFDILRAASNEVLAQVIAHPDVLRATSSVADASPQAEIVVDPLKAAYRNLTPQQISNVIYTALNSTESSKITIDDQQYTIYIEYPADKYNSVSDIANMMVVSGTGASIPLTEVASIEFSDTPQTISRENNQYVITVTATPFQAAKYTAQSDLNQLVSEMNLPSGVSMGQSSQDESMNEEFTSLITAILTSIFLVFMVMAIQFESIRHSIMVMVCIPFSVIGSFSLMYLLGTTISMVSLLGFLILVGTVVNNGILFVDTANQYRKSMELETALVYTGRTRLRPILMTTLTTILSMIPLAVGIGSGAEMMKGLGVTVIGGLTVSTLLTLLLLPSFYLMIDGNPGKRKARRDRINAKRLRKHLEEDEPENPDPVPELYKK